VGQGTTTSTPRQSVPPPLRWVRPCEPESTSFGRWPWDPSQGPSERSGRPAAARRSACWSEWRIGR